MLRIEGIVGIAHLCPAKQRGGIADGRQRPAVLKPLRQVRISNKRPAESHQVGETGGEDTFRLLLIVIAGHDQGAAEGRAQRVTKVLGNGWRIVPVRLRQVDKGDTLLFAPGRQGKDGVDHLRVVHPALGNEGGKADARPLAANDVADGGQHLLGKTDPVAQATAVLISTLVGGTPQELVDQIALPPCTSTPSNPAAIALRAA